MSAAWWGAPIRWDAPLVEGDTPLPPRAAVPTAAKPHPPYGLNLRDGRCGACGGCVHDWPQWTPTGVWAELAKGRR